MRRLRLSAGDEAALPSVAANTVWRGTFRPTSLLRVAPWLSAADLVAAPALPWRGFRREFEEPLFEAGAEEVKMEARLPSL